MVAPGVFVLGGNGCFARFFVRVFVLELDLDLARSCAIRAACVFVGAFRRSIFPRYIPDFCRRLNAARSRFACGAERFLVGKLLTAD